MTASRSCRACGAELRGDVRWCLRCYEPVRQLTPREPQLPTIQFLREPDAGRERSRWKAGVTTFGPAGRVAVTLVVLAFAPWTTNVVALAAAWPAYLAIAGIVLHSTWRKDDVATMRVREMAIAGGSSGAAEVEPVRMPVPRSTIVAWVVLGAVGLGGALAWLVSGSVGRGIVGICASLAGLVLAVRWLARP